MSTREGDADCESSHSCLVPSIEDAGEIWNLIIARLPRTAHILREMEKVINDAQHLLHHFETINHSQNYKSNQIRPPVIHDSDNVSFVSNGTSNENDKSMIDEPVQSTEVATITVDHPNKTDSLEEWNQFSSAKTMEPSRPLSGTSYHSPSTSSSSSATSFHNAKSMSTLDQANGESLTINNPLYEIEKINALDYESVEKNYESAISSTKQATQIIKHVESTSPTMTMKEVMLAPIKSRICSHVGDSPTIDNLNQLEIETKPKSDIESPRQSLPSPRSDRPSSIPRPISNRSRGINKKK